MPEPSRPHKSMVPQLGVVRGQPNMLLNVEIDELKTISKDFNIIILIVGSRARNEGSNIHDTNKPVSDDKKDSTRRSDIDYVIDPDLPIEIKEKAEEALWKVGNGAGREPIDATGFWRYGAAEFGGWEEERFIVFEPNQEPYFAKGGL